MPAFIIPEDPENEWNDSDWNELIDTMKPGGGDAMSHERSEAVLESLVPANKARAAARRLSGYSLADAADPFRLRRYETPFCHPRWPWLWCDSVGVELVHPKGNPDKPHPDSPDPDNPTLFYPQDDAVDWVGYGPDTVGKYMWAKLTARFTQVSYTVLPDGDALWSDDVPEYRRFFGLVDLQPSSEIVQAEGAQDGNSYKFAETDDPTVAGAPAAGTQEFPGTVYVMKTQAAYTLVWKGVEESYCCKGSFVMPKPTRLLAGLGKVNSTAFMGDPNFPKQTLLFDGLRGKRYQFPVRTTASTGLWAWDWYLTFVNHDPTQPAAVKYSTGTSISDVVRARGHQLRPWRGSRKWYYATPRQRGGHLRGRAAVGRNQLRQHVPERAGPDVKITTTPPLLYRKTPDGYALHIDPTAFKQPKARKYPLGDPCLVAGAYGNIVGIAQRWVQEDDTVTCVVSGICDGCGAESVPPPPPPPPPPVTPPDPPETYSVFVSVSECAGLSPSGFPYTLSVAGSVEGVQVVGNPPGGAWFTGIPWGTNVTATIATSEMVWWTVGSVGCGGTSSSGISALAPVGGSVCDHMAVAFSVGLCGPVATPTELDAISIEPGGG